MVIQVLGLDGSLPAYSPLATNGASASRLEQALPCMALKMHKINLDLNN